MEGRALTLELRKIAGLGVYVTELYPSGRCFLKGFFNVIEGFRDGQDFDGWQLATAMGQAQGLDLGITSAAVLKYPEYTRITPELKLHADELLQLFSPLEPLTLHLRPTDAQKLRYFAADASVEGFRSVLQYPDGSTKRRDCLWMPSFAEGGSNLREATV